MSLSPSVYTAASPRRRVVFNRRLHPAACLLLAACAGCGGADAERVPVYPAKGKITFKGQPTPGAFIAFHPKTPLENVPNPRASVDQQGNFAVSTFNGGDGAPAGRYVLTVQWYKPVKQGADVVAGPNVLPGKYAAAESSTLEVRIAAGENNLPPIQL